MISHKHKFIFVRVPKTGSTSVIKALGLRSTQDRIWASRYPSNPVWDGDLNHYPLSVVEKMVEPDIYKTYFKFGFVRNPWDKIVSQFFYSKLWWNQIGEKELVHKHQRMTMDTFNKQKKKALCENLRNFKTYILELERGNYLSLPTPYFKISDDEMVEGCDFVGRFENLQNDYKHVCNKLGIMGKKLPATNKTFHHHYTHYYDNRTQEIVGQKCAAVIEKFDYKYKRNTRFK